jgi:OmpA-OmpF porin, OOP family
MMKSMTKCVGVLVMAMFAISFSTMAIGADMQDFERALSNDYNALSQSELAQGDTRDAETYARRAADAAAGNPTAPDQVELRRPFLKDHYVADLSQARARLVTALEATGRTDAPAAAARAQSAYDCWLEQASEDLQPDHIKACRDSFMTAMDAVEAAATKVVVAEPPPPPPPAPAPVETFPENFIVFFDFDRSEITPEGMTVIRSAEAAATGTPFKRIRATGHTDRSGSDRYNQALSQRRADAVKAALAKAGVRAGDIEVVARGESEPLVETDDGVREAQNRRVEILIER